MPGSVSDFAGCAARQSGALDPGAGRRPTARFVLALPSYGHAGWGLRQGEVFGLAVDDVEFLRGVMHVRRQVKRLGGRQVFPPPKAIGAPRAAAGDGRPRAGRAPAGLAGDGCRVALGDVTGGSGSEVTPVDSRDHSAAAQLRRREGLEAVATHRWRPADPRERHARTAALLRQRATRRSRVDTRLCRVSRARRSGVHAACPYTPDVGVRGADPYHELLASRAASRRWCDDAAPTPAVCPYFLRTGACGLSKNMRTERASLRTVTSAPSRISGRGLAGSRGGSDTPGGRRR